jgi:hypothetical protein
VGQVYYTGQRLPSGGTKVLRIHDQDVFDLDPCLDLKNHSPTGFEWGYQGSGPAQLALAILADYLADDTLALEYYQDFKRDTISRIESDAWVLTLDHLQQYMRRTCDGEV